MQFEVENRRIHQVEDTIMIGDNADYIAVFTFDNEWNGLTKTARFERDDDYVDVLLNNDACVIPIEMLTRGYLTVGVYSANMTTTPCRVYITPSVKNRNGEVYPPTPDVYEQLLDMIDNLDLSDYYTKEETDELIPTKTSDLTNDSGYITNANIPTKTSDLTNDSGFITSAAIPTNVSSFTNDADYATETYVDNAVAGAVGTTVSVTQKTSSGVNIADITVDGVTTQLFAPNSGGGGGGTYTAGTGIDIDANDVISLDNTTQTTLASVSGKQDALAAGANITISGNTISATDTTYTAGSGINITNNVISATGGSGGSSYLSGLTDVSLSNLEDAQVLMYDSAEQKWENNTINLSGFATHQEVSDAVNDLEYDINIGNYYNKSEVDNLIPHTQTTETQTVYPFDGEETTLTGVTLPQLPQFNGGTKLHLKVQDNQGNNISDYYHPDAFGGAVYNSFSTNAYSFNLSNNSTVSIVNASTYTSGTKYYGRRKLAYDFYDETAPMNIQNRFLSDTTGDRDDRRYDYVVYYWCYDVSNMTGELTFTPDSDNHEFQFGYGYEGDSDWTALMTRRYVPNTISVDNKNYVWVILNKHKVKTDNEYVDDNNFTMTVTDSNGDPVVFTQASSTSQLSTNISDYIIYGYDSDTPVTYEVWTSSIDDVNNSNHYTFTVSNFGADKYIRYAVGIGNTTQQVTVNVPVNMNNYYTKTQTDNTFALINSVPTKTSDLINDSGFVSNVNVPTKTSDLTNDSGFITNSSLSNYYTKTEADNTFAVPADIPTKTSDLTNDSGFITSASLPTKVSDLTNDSGFITSSSIPTNVSAFTNDAGYLTQHQSLANYYTKTETDAAISTAIGGAINAQY